MNPSKLKNFTTSATSVSMQVRQLLVIAGAACLTGCGDDATTPTPDAITDTMGDAALDTTADTTTDTSSAPDSATSDTATGADTQPTPDTTVADTSTPSDVAADDTANDTTTPTEPVFTPIVIPNGTFEISGPGGVPANWNVGAFYGLANASTGTVPTGPDTEDLVAQVKIFANTYMRMRPENASVDAIAAGELYRVRARVRLAGTPQEEWVFNENGPWTPPVAPIAFNVQLASFEFDSNGNPTRSWEQTWSPPTPLTQSWQILEATHLVTAEEAGMQLFVRLTARHDGPEPAVVLIDEVTLERATNRPLPPAETVLNASFEAPTLPDGEFSYGLYGWRLPLMPNYAGIVRHGADIIGTPPDGAQALELGGPTSTLSTLVPFTPNRYHRVSVSAARRSMLGSPLGHARLGVVSAEGETVLADTNVPSLGGAWTRLDIPCFRPSAEQVDAGLRILLNTLSDGRTFFDDVRVEVVDDSLCMP